MAGKSAILSVRIVGDATSASKAFRESEKRAKAMQATFERSAKIAAGALVGLAAAAWKVADVASEAQQAAGAVESVFGSSSKAVLAFADDASQAVGLSAKAYNEVAAVLGAQLGNMGLAGDKLVGTTDQLVGVGADLAATFGGTTADAVSAVSSLLRGERDPIERYGVAIKQADIEARKAAMGLEGLEGEAARNADMQATLAILMEQTSGAQGQFARESDTAAGAQQRMTAEWENAQATLGEALLPTLTTLATHLSTAARWASENQSTVLALGVALGAFATALVVARGAQIAMNIALAANPVGLVITAVGLLVTAIALIASNWDKVKAAMAPVIDWMTGAIEGIIGWFEKLGGWIADTFGAVGDFFGGIGEGFMGAFSGDAGVMTLTADTSAISGFAPTILSADSGLTGSARFGTKRPVTSGGDTYTYNINGGLDSADTIARKIQSVNAERGKRSGRGMRGGTTWRR
ncbi:MAG: hypothetical protein ACTMIR_13565 [Cellulomonadaceae bacterium]